MLHQPITQTATVQLLQSQLTRLNAALVEAADNGQPEVACMAKRYAARVSVALEQPPRAIEVLAGNYGENGWAPAIDSICRQAKRRWAA